VCTPRRGGDEMSPTLSGGKRRAATECRPYNVILKPMKARVCWVNKEAGGRETLPPGPRYSTVARFAAEKGKWTREAFSLILEFHDPPDESLCMIVDVSLLNPDGPTGLLRPGRVFELYEGRQVVARGEVL
jgi:hypothetical protein